MNMNINKAGKNSTVIKFKNGFGSTAKDAARNNDIMSSTLPFYFTVFNDKTHNRFLSKILY